MKEKILSIVTQSGRLDMGADNNKHCSGGAAGFLSSFPTIYPTGEQYTVRNSMHLW